MRAPRSRLATSKVSQPVSEYVRCGGQRRAQQLNATGPARAEVRFVLALALSYSRDLLGTARADALGVCGVAQGSSVLREAQLDALGMLLPFAAGTEELATP